MSTTDNPEAAQEPAPEAEAPAETADALPPEPPPKPGISRSAIALLAAWLALGTGLVWAPSQAAGVLTFLFVLTGWMLSVCVHEFGHAFTAHLGGDTSIAAKGYLRLDPLKYADLGTSLVIPLIALALGGIGFPGGAVYLRLDLIRSRRMRALASLAGPLGTLVVLIGLVALLYVLANLVPQPNPLFAALAFLAFLQATALVLNLLPLPGLDGYGAIRPFLPPGVQLALRPVERFAMLLLLALIFFVPGGSDLIFRPAIVIVDLMGIPRPLIGVGYDTFTFWNGAG